MYFIITKGSLCVSSPKWNLFETPSKLYVTQRKFIAVTWQQPKWLEEWIEKYIADFERPKLLNPLSASVALDLHSKSVDWFLYEGNTGT